MSSQKTHHRTRSLERKNSTPGKAKTDIARKFSNRFSPEHTEMTDNEAKKSKPENANEQKNGEPVDLAKFVISIQAGMDAMNEKMDNLSKSLNERIDQLTIEVRDIRTDLRSTKDQIESCKTKQIEFASSLNAHEIRLNIMDQKNLDTQLMISNLPMSLNTETFIESILKWSGNTVQMSNINSTNFNTFKGTKTAFIHFQNQGDKDKIMAHVKQNHKDNDQKHIPILCEQIFELKEDDPGRSNILYFQTPLTAFNRSVVDKVKKMKKQSKSIERYWLMKGSIHIKLQNQEKSLKIDSLEQLEALKTSIPMEIE